MELHNLEIGKMIRATPVQSKKKRLVYVMATLVAMVIFLPFQNQPWSLYAGACSGYTVLVFGLRRSGKDSSSRASEHAKPFSELLLTHAVFLAIVIGWVWLALQLRPHLPYILRRFR